MEPRRVIPLEYETPRPRLPPAVVVVAWVFIGVGILSVIEMVTSLWNNHCSLNVGVLGIFIGRGLLRRTRGWRSAAIVFLWAILILVPLILLLVLLGGGTATVGNRPATDLEATLMFLGIAVFLAGLVWVLRILSRPEVRALYEPEKLE